MKDPSQFRAQAVFLRESSGSSNIEQTLLKALKVLKLFHIPHYVCGGFTVQEQGHQLSTYMGRGIERSQDYADVVKLVQVNSLSRDFGIDPKVLDEYQKIWDALNKSGTN